MHLLVKITVLRNMLFVTINKENNWMCYDKLEMIYLRFVTRLAEFK